MSLAYTKQGDSNDTDSGKKFRLHAKDISIHNNPTVVTQLSISSQKSREGEITLHGGLATLRVPEGCRFLNGPDAQTVVLKLWQIHRDVGEAEK